MLRRLFHLCPDQKVAILRTVKPVQMDHRHLLGFLLEIKTSLHKTVSTLCKSRNKQPGEGNGGFKTNIAARGRLGFGGNLLVELTYA